MNDRKRVIHGRMKGSPRVSMDLSSYRSMHSAKAQQEVGQPLIVNFRVIRSRAVQSVDDVRYRIRCGGGAEPETLTLCAFAAAPLNSHICEDK